MPTTTEKCVFFLQGAVGVYDAARTAMQLSPGGTRLLVVSSVVGIVAPPTRTGYAASKFALKGNAQLEVCPTHPFKVYSSTFEYSP